MAEFIEKYLLKRQYKPLDSLYASNVRCKACWSRLPSLSNTLITAMSSRFRIGFKKGSHYFSCRLFIIFAAYWIDFKIAMKCIAISLNTWYWLDKVFLSAGYKYPVMRYYICYFILCFFYISLNKLQNFLTVLEKPG